MDWVMAFLKFHFTVTGMHTGMHIASQLGDSGTTGVIVKGSCSMG
jgi:hypothetical protein